MRGLEPPPAALGRALVMNYEDELEAAFRWMLRAGVSPRSIRVFTREIVVNRLSEGPLERSAVSETVRSCVLGAARVAVEGDSREELLRLVSAAALEAVHGQGGETALWLADARRALRLALQELQAAWLAEDLL